MKKRVVSGEKAPQPENPNPAGYQGLDIRYPANFIIRVTLNSTIVYGNYTLGNHFMNVCQFIFMIEVPCEWCDSCEKNFE